MLKKLGLFALAALGILIIINQPAAAANFVDSIFGLFGDAADAVGVFLGNLG